MPTSNLSQINDIMQLIIFTNPRKILDIGVGFGKYGFLSREYLELWDGREKYDEWNRRIDGIEVFGEYITPVHDFIYNKTYIGNAIDILPTIDEKYDLILLIDVFEHFDYDSGLKLLKECEKHGKNILISVPKNMTHQEAAFGNPYEAHKCQWKKNHFIRYANKFFFPNMVSLIIYIGEDSQDVLRKAKKYYGKLIVARKAAYHLKDTVKRLLKK